MCGLSLEWDIKYDALFKILFMFETPAENRGGLWRSQ